MPGLSILQGKANSDNRGEFSRLFCAKEMLTILGTNSFAQVNRSLSHESGVIRGLHFQRPPHAEIKLVRCIRGRVWDVAVDLREDSPTFLKWYAEELSGHNHKVMVIPEGFAHGFQVLDKESELIYFHSKPYQPFAEGGLRYDDPALTINWPLPARNVSNRDLSFPFISEGFTGL
ncbi:dTDP-4-dehydrorhamnose 3,5-epimerase [Parahaliea maris]|uniref:dTDP-4-dehydrorhamnose 3,5-epimerase n=1 Tax=Parahaliea maris TaxID=2716870 RepID=A0A5C9A9P7_9GAMM|nr:dTDP-4-dehydrorhamnose 3,5-epimerase [Parahaliea maris]